MDQSSIAGVAINIGSQTKYHGRGPIRADGSFEYVPIPESDDSVDFPTYEELGVNASIVNDGKDTVAHFDPEFPELGIGEHYTYGDPTSKKRHSLEKLGEGDYVFFYCTLDFVDDAPDRYWINTGWGGYIIGHFKLAIDPLLNKADYENASDEIKDVLANNAHLRRSELEDDIIFLIGDPSRSKLYETPTPLSLPGQVLSAADKANHVFEMAGTDAKGVWYRGPIEFNHDVTETLLQANQRETYNQLMGKPLTDQPGFGDFVDHFYSVDEFEDLKDLFKSRELDEEERLLASFLYIVGGWSTLVPKTVFDVVDRPITSVPELLDYDTLPSALTETFGELRGTGWPHGHRNNIPRAAGRLRPAKEDPLEPYITEVQMNAIESLADQTTRMTEFVTDLEGETFPFDEGMTRLKRISSFGRLSAFDFMEILVRVNEREQLAPTRLKKAYIDTSGPKQGFKHVFGEALEGTIPDARRIQHLTLLVGYACEERDMSYVDAIFAVESALCNCQKGQSHSELTDMGYSPETPPSELENVDNSDWNC